MKTHFNVMENGKWKMEDGKKHISRLQFIICHLPSYILHNIRLRFIPLFILFTFASPCFSQNKIAKDIVNKMLVACDNVKTAKYTLKRQERSKNNEMAEAEGILKLQTNPFKVYLYNIKPNVGAEVLYIKGENSGNAYVHPNQFPYINLNLNPYGSTLREKQHHTLLDLGFACTASLVRKFIKTNETNFYNWLTYNGEVEWNGKMCYKLTLDNKPFAYISYTVQKGETITTIANKLGVVDYMILYINPTIDDYDDVKAGQIIKVPNSYSRKIIFYVDKIYYLPLVQIVYDDKGLFEKYELHSFILNPVIKPEEFTPKYKDYKF